MPQVDTKALPLRARISPVRRLAVFLVEAAARRRDRRALAELDPHLLRDIGLTADEAKSEAGKPFWQP
jgi:uncharacterized protein YjiS (DUF1127 family)